DRPVALRRQRDGLCSAADLGGTVATAARGLLCSVGGPSGRSGLFVAEGAGLGPGDRTDGGGGPVGAMPGGLQSPLASGRAAAAGVAAHVGGGGGGHAVAGLLRLSRHR